MSQWKEWQIVIKIKNCQPRKKTSEIERTYEGYVWKLTEKIITGQMNINLGHFTEEESTQFFKKIKSRKTADLDKISPKTRIFEDTLSLIMRCWVTLLCQPHQQPHIYIYIYSHPQTDCFVLSELFSVARHGGRSKTESKPVQLYDRQSFRPLGQQRTTLATGIFRYFIF